MAIFSISTILIIANLLVSYKGFKDQSFYEKYKFEIDKVLVYKEYYRLFTSGFLHVGWSHLLFNMLSLYIFSNNLESFIGPVYFLLIYTIGLIGGEVLSLFMHRHHGEYSSVGASGAICAVLFAAIAIFPGMNIGLILLPSIPGWLFGLIYVLVSIYGIRSRTNNIGHDAHLGGGLAGLLVAILLFPSAILNNTFTILIVALPAIAFILFILYKPQFLLIDNYFFKKQHYLNVEDKYNLDKRNKQQDLDKLLEKIHNKGMSSLSKKEREMLHDYSK